MPIQLRLKDSSFGQNLEAQLLFIYLRLVLVVEVEVVLGGIQALLAVAVAEAVVLLQVHFL
jgi:hypothetical protein